MSDPVRSLAATACLAGILTLTSCSDRGAVPKPTYTGGAACAACHEQETNSWAGSHHDLAMQAANEESVLGDFSGTTFTYNGITSTFFRQDGRFMVRTDGLEGQLQDYAVEYTFGFLPLQQYLIRFPGGRLQALGIAWDSGPPEDGGQRWLHLYPDEVIDAGDPLHWTGINQNWNYMCAECHSTNLRKRYVAEDDRYETTWTDIDVNCETCHGPGSNHVDWAEARDRGEKLNVGPHTGLVVSLGDSTLGPWIMNLDTGTAEREPNLGRDTLIESCAPCHSRRGKIRETYLPGDPFLDAYRPALLDEGLYFADGQIQDEVYVYGSFLQSKMYAAGVTCIDCHNAHSLSLLAPGNELCGRCHLPTKYDSPDHHFHRPDSTGGQCVACHMPERTYMVVDPRRDHSMRVPRPGLAQRIGAPDACTGCHAGMSQQQAADSLAEWYGKPDTSGSHYGDVLFAGRSGDENAGIRLAALSRDTTAPAIVRSTALSLLDQYAGREMGEAVREALGDGSPLIRLGALQALEAFGIGIRMTAASSLLSDSVRAVRIEAARLLAPAFGGDLGEDERSRLDRAIAEYVAAEQVNADRPEAHLNLGYLYASLGRYPEAEEEYRAAIGLRPSDVMARVNLADLYRLQGREAAAETVLREALELAPNTAEVHHALGLLLVRVQRLSEGIKALRKAASLRPDVVRFSYVYGIALQSSGETDLAVKSLTDALARHPDDRDLLFALATIHRDAGTTAEALRYARRLAAAIPGDPSAAALIQELESEPASGAGPANPATEEE